MGERFNPNRDFTGDELWNGHSFSGYNPSTPRFAPFTHPPRDCLGKNFAQMEMRAILSYLLKDFTFTLGDLERAEFERGEEHVGINAGTMGPRSLKAAQENPRTGSLGLEFYAQPRR